jgi:hypothetical protein
VEAPLPVQKLPKIHTKYRLGRHEHNTRLVGQPSALLLDTRDPKCIAAPLYIAAECQERDNHHRESTRRKRRKHKQHTLAAARRHNRNHRARPAINYLDHRRLLPPEREIRLPHYPLQRVNRIHLYQPVPPLVLELLRLLVKRARTPAEKPPES